MYGPAVRCKRFSSSCRFAVLHQCIRPLIGAFAPGHDGYQRARVLISGQASSGPFGSPVFACAGKTDPPSLLIPLADLGWKLLIGLRHRLLLISRSSFVRAKGPFLRPGPQNVDRVARRGRSRPAVALGLRLAPALPGCALTAPSTTRGSSGSDACIVGPRQLEGASFSQHRPGDAGKLVGERDREHVVVQPPFGGFDPGFEPVTFPVLYPDQHNPGRLHEQNAQVAIAAPGDFAEDRAVSRRDLLGHQSEPGAEVAAFGEYVSSADRGHHGARNDRPDASRLPTPR